MNLNSNRWLVKIVELGFMPADDGDVRRKKVALVLVPLIIAPAAFVWGVVYFLLGHGFSGLIPMSYSIISVLSLIYFFRTKKTWFIMNLTLLYLLTVPWFNIL